MRYLSVFLVLPLLSCMTESRGPTSQLALSVAPLNLPGVGEAIWDLEVLDGEGAVVFQRRLTSSRYGDSAGALTYVGPCNAQASGHSVRLWLAGLFEAPVASPGEFAAGADVPGALEYVDPSANGPLVQAATCSPNADTPVRFDVAVMRPARQGFFDIAVTFDDIFCSAKFDCCGDDNEDGVCAPDGSEDHLLLFDEDGARASTMVLGFACSAGVGEGSTELFLDPLWLDCTTGNGAFSVDIAVTPGGPPGNQCEPGVDGMSGCAIVTEYGDADADDALYQVGVYRGVEALESNGVDANKVYWNIALGIKRPLIGECVLRTRGSAARGNGSGMAGDGTIADGAVYPVIAWDVDLGACTEEALSFGDQGMVRVAYSGAANPGEGAAFAYGYSSARGARAFCSSPCVCAGEPLPDGTTCDDGLVCTRGDACQAGVCAGTEECTAAPGECWVAVGACDAGGACAYDPKAPGEPCTEDGNPCTVDQCDGAGGCEHVAGHVGTVCRAMVDVCDLTETCDGSEQCPPDVKAAIGVQCREAVDECDVAEFCVGADECPAPSVSFCGACGTAESGSTQEAPVDGLCAVGTASGFSGEGPWSWTCDGQDGADASCASDRSCGATTLTFGPCSADVVGAEHGFEDQVDNTDAGHVGLVTARCDQGEWVLSGQWCEPIVDGVCGAADGGDSESMPSGGLCGSGVASAVSGAGPWNWTCAGVNGGADSQCTSYKSCSASMLSWGSCSAAVDLAVRAGGQALANEVLGYQGLATATCSAAGDGVWSLSGTSCDQTVVGVCGAAAGGDTAARPDTGLCASGVASTVSGSGPWTWSCSGAFGGTDDTCTSYKTCAAGTQTWGSCSASVTVANRSGTQSLTNGAAGWVGGATATCSASGDGSWSLSGTSCNPIINGSCGAANGGDSASAPSTSLCSSGTPTTVSGTGPWTWSCTGANTGSTASCTSYKTCAAGAQTWGSCSASVTVANRSGTQSLTNGAAGWVGGATATCSASGDGSWSLSGTSCNPIINGSCGAANGGDSASAPSTGLCTSGTPTTVSGTGPWTWSCTGANTGSTASCTSFRTCAAGTQTWGSCSASVTVANRSGTQSLTNGAAGWVGGATATCSASGDGSWSLSGTSCNQIINGSCGAAHGGNTATAPSTSLCTSGTPTTVSGTGPWTWSCTGANTGSTASCTSYRTCAAGTQTWGSCSASVTVANRSGTQSLTNSAAGWVGGATATCSATGNGSWSLSGTSCNQIINGTCGSSSGADLASVPSTNLCASGTPTTVSGTGPWTWSCTGANTGSTASCTAYRTCAATSLSWSNCSATPTAATRSQTRALTNGAGGYQGSATATCSATGNGAWSLSSTVCNQTVNGACGSANGGSSTSAPTANLCASGSPTGVSGVGPYTWSCTGAFGGSTASCSSNRSCGAQTLSWSSCSGSQSAQAHGYSASLANSTSGFTGSATASCSQGAWSTTNTTCTATGCTPGDTQDCGQCWCGRRVRTCLANGTWGTCMDGPDCQPANTDCR